MTDWLAGWLSAQKKMKSGILALGALSLDK